MAAPEFICNETDDRAAWLEARRSGIGGSDCPAVLGISPFSTPAKVAALKRGLLPDEDSETELMTWGRMVEPLLIQTFLDDMERAGKKGWQAKPSGKLYRCSKPGQEMMLATVDGQAVDPSGRAGVVECKLKIFGSDEWDREGVPDYVVAQTQHNGEVVDAGFGVVIGLLGGYRPRWKILERAEDLLADVIVPAEQDFWKRCQAGDPFPLDQGRGEVNLALVRRLYPDDSGELVRLEGPEILATAREWRLQAERRIAAGKLEKTAQAVLFGAIGGATYGMLDDGTQLSLKTQRTAEAMHKASQTRVLRQDSSKTARRVARELKAAARK